MGALNDKNCQRPNFVIASVRTYLFKSVIYMALDHGTHFASSDNRDVTN
jgi:hypothetical protein